MAVISPTGAHQHRLHDGQETQKCVQCEILLQENAELKERLNCILKKHPPSLEDINPRKGLDMMTEEDRFAFKAYKIFVEKYQSLSDVTSLNSEKIQELWSKAKEEMSQSST